MTALTDEVLAHLALEIIDAHALPTWSERADYILEACTALTGSRAGLLYVLHLSTGEYERQFATSDDGTLPTRFSLQNLETMPELDVQTPHERPCSPRVMATWTLLPVCRQGNPTPLFILALNHPNLGAEAAKGIQTLLSPLLAAYVARRVGKILDGSRSPVDYRTNWENYLSQLGDVILSASGFRYAALRELRGNRLDCIAAWGFDQPPDLRLMSWPKDRFRSFHLASEGTATSEVDLQLSQDREISQVALLEPIRGYAAVPILVGAEVFGVMTVATSVPYLMAEAELQAIRTLGNTIGLSISLFRNPTGQAPASDYLADVSARSQLEIIGKSARHEGLGLVDNAIALCMRLEKSDLTPKVRQSSATELEGTLLELSSVLEKIQSAAQPPTYSWERVGLLQIWEQVISINSGRLDAMNVATSHSGRDVQIECYRDWIQSMFMQLLLNSMDAFNRKGVGLRAPSSKNRTISLTIDPLRKKSNRVTFRYHDNATGINLRALKYDSKFEHLSPSERLFAPGASTKGSGDGGWGLALVRKTISEHGGSIELWDNSLQGATFQISLPIGHEQDDEG